MLKDRPTPPFLCSQKIAELVLSSKTRTVSTGHLCSSLAPLDVNCGGFVFHYSYLMCMDFNLLKTLGCNALNPLLSRLF